MDLRNIAQQLIDELETAAAEYKLKAEGAALLYDRIVKIHNEKKAKEVEAAEK